VLPSHQVRFFEYIYTKPNTPNNHRLISSYLDRPEVRTLLGVDTAITSNFSSCNFRVNNDFSNNLDELHPTQHYVAALLDRNIKVLIYVGKYDYVCNHVGNEAWTLALDWSGDEEFFTQPLREWKVDGKSVGTMRSAKGLAFVTIDGAGHMVCCCFFLLSLLFLFWVSLTGVFFFLLPGRCLMINPRKLWNLLTGG
jgi:carboxypeptidase C (cathepsin A)